MTCFVVSCITPRKIGSPSSPCAMIFPSRRSVDAVCPVERLGDDRRERRLLMDEVHLARDLPESVLDHRQGNGVRHGVSDGAGGGLRFVSDRPLPALGDWNEQVAEAVDLRDDPRLDGDGGVKLLDNRGAFDRRSRCERGAVVDRGVVQFAVESDRGGRRCATRSCPPRPARGRARRDRTLGGARLRWCAGSRASAPSRAGRCRSDAGSARRMLRGSARGRTPGRRRSTRQRGGPDARSCPGSNPGSPRGTRNRWLCPR